jgi:hypothetical protein
MDMSLVFLIAVGLLGCVMVVGLLQSATVIVRERSVKGHRTSKK